MTANVPLIHILGERIRLNPILQTFDDRLKTMLSHSKTLASQGIQAMTNSTCVDVAT